MSNEIKGKAARENYITKLISQNGNVNINNLSKSLNVSRETIRRDLKDLEQKNILQCTYGGAMIKTTANSYYESNDANIKYIEEKTAIGKKAASFINDYEAVIILGSTTTAKIGPYLCEKNNITVITNSFIIAKYTLQNSSNSVIILGGEYDNKLQTTTGTIAAEALDHYRADKLFFCPRGVSVIYGITNLPENDTRVIKAALKVSKTSILLSDYSKFWNVGLNKVCDVTEIDIIISDSNLSQKKIAEIAEKNINIVIADPITY